MDNSKFLKIIIIILLIINIGTLGLIWTGRPHGLMPPPARVDVFDFLNHELEMTPEQQVQFRNLRDEHRNNMENLRVKSRDLHDSFFGLLQDSLADRATINQMADSLVLNQKAIEMITFAHFQQVRKLCNPEQQNKFDHVIQEALRRMAPGKPPGR